MLIKPVLPVIDYVINYDYISTKLCENIDKPVLKCNGKCHLGTQLSKTSNKSDDESSEPLRVIFESFLPVFISTSQEVKFNSFIDEIYNKDSFCYANSYRFLHEHKTDKPPIS
jgi:hypothetical protein